MSGPASRLGKVTTGLTGRERAMLVLKALAAGEEPDPQLRVIDDPVQRRAFDRCMGYINAANSNSSRSPTTCSTTLPGWRTSPP